jgi:hypothetical protein
VFGSVIGRYYSPILRFAVCTTVGKARQLLKNGVEQVRLWGRKHVLEGSFAASHSPIFSLSIWRAPALR